MKSITIPSHILQRMVAIHDAAAHDDPLYPIAGLHLVVQSERIHLVATDGKILVKEVWGCDSPGNEERVTLSVEAINRLRPWVKELLRNSVIVGELKEDALHLPEPGGSSLRLAFSPKTYPKYEYALPQEPRNWPLTTGVSLSYLSKLEKLWKVPKKDTNVSMIFNRGFILRPILLHEGAFEQVALVMPLALPPT